MFHGLFSRRILAVGMCCLTMLGAAPRLDCLCASVACQTACESAMLVTRPHDQPCCCHHDTETPTNGAPEAAPIGCHCDLQVSQDHVAPVVRDDAPQPPLVLWLSPASDLLTSMGQGVHDDLAFSSGLPPDDPVSRAQILRI
jgi:hypothetical protein